MKRISSLLLGSLVVILATACGGGGSQEVEYTIDLSEFAYTPDTIELKVGQIVTLNLVNVGTLEHEIMFGRDVVMVDGAATGYEVDMFEFAGVEPEGLMFMGMDDDSTDMEHSDDDDDHADSGHDMEIDSDEHAHEGYMATVSMDNPNATVTFTVTEEMVGEWEFGCFLQEGTHYTAGMYGTLIVTE